MIPKQPPAVKGKRPISYGFLMQLGVAAGLRGGQRGLCRQAWPGLRCRYGVDVKMGWAVPAGRVGVAADDVGTRIRSIAAGQQ